MYHKTKTKSGMHTRVLKFNISEDKVPSRTLVLDYKSKVCLSSCFWVERKHINEPRELRWWLLSIGFSAHIKPNTPDKSSKPPQVDQQRDIPFFIYVNTHTYIKSLLCKIFQSWGLKRQHSSQLSAVPLSSIYCALVCRNITWMVPSVTAALKLPCFWSRCVVVQTPRSHR